MYLTLELSFYKSNRRYRFKVLTVVNIKITAPTFKQMEATGFSETSVHAALHGVTYQKLILKVTAVQRTKDSETSVLFVLQFDASSLFYTILSVKELFCSCQNSSIVFFPPQF
jgi:type II secretory ATPase GspE/PulE/Tfp pilus assembly ATPase PilB-like protein